MKMAWKEDSFVELLPYQLLHEQQQLSCASKLSGHNRDVMG
jgi:hypothetical protein